QTPCRVFEIVSSSVYTKRGETRTKSIPSDARLGTWGPLGGTVTTTAIVREKKFTADALALKCAPFNANLQFFVFGEVRYNDIYGNEYVTDFEFFTMNVFEEPLKE